MTEQEWLQATDPQPMLDFLLGKASERKLRLFAVAACRRIWHLITEGASRRAVETAERYADGLTTSAELADAQADAKPLVHHVGILNVFAAHAACETSSSTISPDVLDPLRIAGKTLIQQIAESAVIAVRWQYKINKIRESRVVKWTRQSTYLRCIFGPLPFHPITIDSAWLTWRDTLLVSMAQRMYDSRDFCYMPVLADALEEAGCSKPDILDHCRSSGEHVRGCWVIDALLGKS